MVEKYKLMIDPTPAGWAYGFPKPLPDEAVLCGGKAYDLYVNPKFDLAKWIVEEGYPEESLRHYRLYPQEVHDKCGTPECCGTCETTEETANKEAQYYYPGSDPQE